MAGVGSGGSLQVYNDSKILIEELQKENWEIANLLMMSSGKFDGLKFEELFFIQLQKRQSRTNSSTFA